MEPYGREVSMYLTVIGYLMETHGSFMMKKATSNLSQKAIKKPLIADPGED